MTHGKDVGPSVEGNAGNPERAARGWLRGLGFSLLEAAVRVLTARTDAEFQQGSSQLSSLLDAVRKCRAGGGAGPAAGALSIATSRQSSGDGRLCGTEAVPPAAGRASVPALLRRGSAPPLIEVIRRELAGTSVCRIASAFCTRGMLNVLVRPLESFCASGGQLRLLTSVMNGFNDPDDLLHLQREVPRLELRVFLPGFREGVRRWPPPFHIKCFLFEKRDGRHSLIIGSSNLTWAGLVGNHEWNLFSVFEANLPFGEDEATIFAGACEAFDRYWAEDSTECDDAFLAYYRPIHERCREAHRAAEEALVRPDVQPPAPRPEPTQAQKEALESLRRKRALGVARTAVIAATGLGKTHLAAFDFQQSGLRNVLFIAHRENILRQARQTYARVLGVPDFGVVLAGDSSPEDRRRAAAPGSNVFAMIQTLNASRTLCGFARDHFDYVVVDEFHHAEAVSYRRAVEWFAPRFFLGLTATPERADGRDVLSLCDYDVAYEARLFQAIDSGWLVPFQYFAIYDPTDYSQIRWTGMGYDEAELEAHLSRDTRAELIIRNLRRFMPSSGKTKALAFCAGRGHALYMDAQFRRHGIESLCLLGTSAPGEREAAVARLADEKDPLQVICSVDVFSEGVDVPPVTHVLLLRPTESATVFQQQIGRGLRRAPDKEYVVVLDFVGNFRNNFAVPVFLGERAVPQTSLWTAAAAPFRLPALCTVDADQEVQRVWDQEIRRALGARNREQVLRDAYSLVRARLGYAPGILDLYANPEAAEPAAFIKHFGSWLETRKAMGDLDAYETRLLGTPAEAFLEHLESDLHPVRSYKMAVLSVLLDDEPSRTEWPVSRIAEGFRRYYLEHPEYLSDYDELARSPDPAAFPLTRVAAKLVQMPLRYLSNTEDKFFRLDRSTGIFAVKPPLVPWWRDETFRDQVRQRVLYALREYFRRKRLPPASE